MKEDATYGYESLLAAVKKDCQEGNDCFNENGCDHEFYRYVPQDNQALRAMGITESCKRVSKCQHKYCDKFKWAIERAQYYADKTNLKQEQVLEIWEKDRSYWYMNYYADHKIPLDPKFDEEKERLLKSEIEYLSNKVESVSKSILKLSEEDEDVLAYMTKTLNDFKRSLENSKNRLQLLQLNKFIV